jgi:hypothetical protein
MKENELTLAIPSPLSSFLFLWEEGFIFSSPQTVFFFAGGIFDPE